MTENLEWMTYYVQTQHPAMHAASRELLEHVHEGDKEMPGFHCSRDTITVRCPRHGCVYTIGVDHDAPPTLEIPGDAGPPMLGPHLPHWMILETLAECNPMLEGMECET